MRPQTEQSSSSDAGRYSAQPPLRALTAVYLPNPRQPERRACPAARRKRFPTVDSSPATAQAMCVEVAPARTYRFGIQQASKRASRDAHDRREVSRTVDLATVGRLGYPGSTPRTAPIAHQSDREGSV